MGGRERRQGQGVGGRWGRANLPPHTRCGKRHSSLALFFFVDDTATPLSGPQPHAPAAQPATRERVAGLLAGRPAGHDDAVHPRLGVVASRGCGCGEARGGWGGGRGWECARMLRRKRGRGSAGGFRGVMGGLWARARQGKQGETGVVWGVGGKGGCRRRARGMGAATPLHVGHCGGYALGALKGGGGVGMGRGGHAVKAVARKALWLRLGVGRRGRWRWREAAATTGRPPGEESP